MMRPPSLTTINLGSANLPRAQAKVRGDVGGVTTTIATVVERDSRSDKRQGQRLSKGRRVRAQEGRILCSPAATAGPTKQDNKAKPARTNKQSHNNSQQPKPSKRQQHAEQQQQVHRSHRVDTTLRIGGRKSMEEMKTEMDLNLNKRHNDP